MVEVAWRQKHGTSSYFVSIFMRRRVMDTGTQLAFSFSCILGTLHSSWKDPVHI